jgi:hypothetical protein
LNPGRFCRKVSRRPHLTFRHLWVLIDFFRRLQLAKGPEDSDRSFYPTVLIVIASYYVLFAVMGASGQTLLIEIAAASVFLLFVVLGFRKNLWLVSVAIIGHGIFDFVHHLLIENRGYPVGGLDSVWHLM